MAREKLKDFLNQKGSTTDSISYVRDDDIVNGLGDDPGTGESLLDLLNENRGLLGDYLSFLTSEAKNEFMIKPGNSQANTSKRGDSLDIADNQGAEKVFVEQGGVLKSKLNEYSNSGKFDEAGVPLDSIIDKTSKEGSSHEMLKNITGRGRDIYGNTLVDPPGDENNVVQATNKMLLNNNRFANVGSSQNQSFTIKPQTESNFEDESKTNNVGTLTVQNKFGVYDKDLNIVNVNELKEIGKSLLENASGFKDEINSLVSSTTGFNKVDFLNVESKNASGFPKTEENSDVSTRANRGNAIEPDGSSESSKTFGTTYNTEVNFQGKNSNLVLAEAMTSMLALKTIANDFYGRFIELLRTEDRITMQADTNDLLRKNESIDVGTYMLGRSRHMSSVIINHKIFSKILTNTKYPYSDAVTRGLEVIFTESSPGNAPNIAQSAGFWLAVSRSILKSFDNIVTKYTEADFNISDTNRLFLIYYELLETNKFIQFYNAMAAIGDISLDSTDGLKNNIPKPGELSSNVNIRNVDNLPNIGAYAAGKSRKSDGGLSWNQDATPSSYILPANIVRAAVQLNNILDGTNPARGLLGSKLVENTYFGVDVDGSGNRIPNEVVKNIEDKLDAEYVPFYIQDLRTNEIISFNAFLESLNDNIRANFNEVDGYGRLDPVQIYSGTKRTVSVGFTLMATNREDFDSMWYKINKITTLFYPQWTPGTMVGTDGLTKFYQPFSQVIGASPIVRLRVGDIIKSNYSKFALARTFGIGDSNVNANPSEEGEGINIGNSKILEGRDGTEAFADKWGTIIQEAYLKTWLTVFGSPISPTSYLLNSTSQLARSNIGKITQKLGTTATLSLLSNFLINGFANPLAVNEVIRKLRDPEYYASDENAGYVSWDPRQSLWEGEVNEWFEDLDIENLDLKNITLAILKPNNNTGYFSPDTGEIHYLPRRLNVRILDGNRGLAGTRTNKYCYKVKIVDVNAPKDRQGNSMLGKHLHVIHTDILPNPKELFSSSIMGLTLYAADPVGSIGDALVGLFDDTAIQSGIPSEALDIVRILYASNSKKFMESGINPITRAFETTRGRGLAGVLDGIQFNWLDSFPWETDFNARAPMGCKISFTLNVIHDIPPGLDHSGFNRAPLYNVGEIMKNVAGDPYDDNGKTAAYNFRNQSKFRNPRENKIKNFDLKNL